MKHFTVSATALVLSFLLTACGAEREEPFEPPEDDDEDEIREPVAVNRIERFTFNDRNATPPGQTPFGRRLEIITDQDDFERLADSYRGSVFVTAPDFSERKAVLYDSGWVDERDCSQQLPLDQVEAFDITEDESVVEVAFTYDFQAADDSAECGEEQYSREVVFYSVDTLAAIVLTEEVEGLDNTTSSSGSASSGSSSSSSASSSSSSSL